VNRLFSIGWGEDVVVGAIAHRLYTHINDVVLETYDNPLRVQAIANTLDTLISTNQIYNLTNTCGDILEHNALHAREIADTHSANKSGTINHIISNINKYQNG
jgi:hypothetical protein